VQSIVGSASLVSSTVLGTTVGNLAMNFFMAGSLSLLWGMLDFLLIIVHIPLLNFVLPANAGVFYEVVFEVAKFDPIPTDDLYDNTFGY